MVRPNSEIIPSEHSIVVKILTQQACSPESLKLTNDRFLVQLTKLDFAPNGQLNNDEISALWDKVDKSKLIQYKLKVELSDDLKLLVK